MRAAISILVFVVSLAVMRAAAADETPVESLFARKVAPVFERHCLRCHNDRDRKGELSLQSAAAMSAGGESGKVVIAGDAAGSLLVEYIEGDPPEMPKGGQPLAAADIASIRRWIDSGATWPADIELSAATKLADTDWWSLRPLSSTRVPIASDGNRNRLRTPIDAFILAELHEQGMGLSPPADRRTLIRRLSYDLLGLPPTPEQIKAFVDDTDPQAYENLVDRMLASPQYGERWARHWLDVVHYGDTHGYDKDKLRPNAWPYRDYVIRSLNEDKAYHRFVEEQLAADVLYPDDSRAIEALGFIAAGPFDWVGHIELREGTVDKQITRNLDRDDMVATTVNTFVSLTAQCARCHDHKFDPITQEDYYSLQAVFAALDRADRQYDPDPAVARRRRDLRERQSKLAERHRTLDAQVRKTAGPPLVAVEEQLNAVRKSADDGQRPEYGYHSAIEPKPDVVKWVQVDLGRAVEMQRVTIVGCHDTFAGIGAGFGFPVRYRIEVSDDPEFKTGVVLVLDHSEHDVPNPGVTPRTVEVKAVQGRYVRVTATRLAHRQNDYIFALAELEVVDGSGTNVALGATVSSLDSIEAPVRWQRTNLVDGYFYGVEQSVQREHIERLERQRQAILRQATPPAVGRELADLQRQQQDVQQELSALPPPSIVFAGATQFAAQGSFRPTGGQPRPIHVLLRGSVQQPAQQVGPGTVGCVAALPARFSATALADEGQRRVALAEWIVDSRNPLTWRSIVNRVWQYHFGAGIVDSPNDFGRMGSLPTHPELLDWLAVWFRDNGQSLKSLHRLMVTSAVYRQSSRDNAAYAKIDGSNRYLWRMNRRRLEAESIRDAVLATSGKLDTSMYGPGFRPFGFKDDHSPHYEYQQYDPDDLTTHRRSVYRFVVRSVPDPFMETLDCADPSLNVGKRNETLTALQALALLNNRFMVRMAEHMAVCLQADAGPDQAAQIEEAFLLALGREATDDELRELKLLASRHGMANVCRLILNMNEFIFVD